MVEPRIVQAFSLALQHHQAGRLQEAEQLYRQILAREPEHVASLHNLGLIAQKTGRTESALSFLGRVVALSPGFPEAHFSLANLLLECGRHEEAITVYDRVIALDPNHAGAHGNQGVALNHAAQHDRAVAAFRRAIALKPSFAEAHSNLANVLNELGQHDEAIAAYRQSLELDPDPRVQSSLIFALNYHPDCDAATLADELERWNERHVEPLGQFVALHGNDRNLDRRLRVGYVSPDLRNHPVGRLMLPLLEGHDRRQVEVFCYTNSTRSDSTTARLKTAADHWRSIAEMSDERAAEQIRGDGIDILVDLAGHTAGNRLLVFAREPAPVQVSYLGYPGTTGLRAMHYRLTDGIADPPSFGESSHTETFYRLSHGTWCFAAPEDSPPVQPPPAMQRGDVTFGSFNSFAKVNEPLLRVWSRILLEVPGSRLLLKAAGLGSQIACQRVTAVLAAQGIDANRVILRGRESAYAGHLQLYSEMDVALDTYPYHGTMTTCEALWMGVPVVTLPGKNSVSRAGVSLLTNIGLEKLVAASIDQYVDLAVALAKDAHRRQQLRASLRERMKGSLLMNAPAFGRDIDAAYRQMWRDWCAQ